MDIKNIFFTLNIKSVPRFWIAMYAAVLFEQYWMENVIIFIEDRNYKFHNIMYTVFWSLRSPDPNYLIIICFWGSGVWLSELHDFEHNSSENIYFAKMLTMSDFGIKGRKLS